MAKQPKQTQTDYTRGGKAISDTAIPLYQTNLGRIDTYLADPMAEQNKYLSTYYTNTSDQNDFNRQYLKNMGQATASNYAATTGGIASLNQQNYDDLQRYYNQYGARLYDTGVTSAYNMANQNYQNMLAANNAYNAAYQLGKPYSDVEQYNYMVDQANSNWWAPVVSTAGSVIGKIPTPATMAIGGALETAGNLFTVDAPTLRSYSAGGGIPTGAYQNVGVGGYQNAMGNLFSGLLDTGVGKNFLAASGIPDFSLRNTLNQANKGEKK